jgi:hypothetical protein
VFIIDTKFENNLFARVRDGFEGAGHGARGKRHRARVTSTGTGFGSQRSAYSFPFCCHRFGGALATFRYRNCFSTYPETTNLLNRVPTPALKFLAFFRNSKEALQRTLSRC